MCKIVCFGLGGFYEENREKLEKLPRTEIIAYSDNNCSRLMEKSTYLPTVSPSALLGLSFDYVVVMSTFVHEIKKQLIKLGIDETKIKTFLQYESFSLDRPIEWFGERKRSNEGRSFLIVSSPIRLNGAVISAISLAKALNKLGFYVRVVSEAYDRNALELFLEIGVGVVIISGLRYRGIEDIPEADMFDNVLINTCQMLKFVEKFKNAKNLFFWTHEPTEFYEEFFKEYGQPTDAYFAGVEVLTVSSVGKRVFNSFFPSVKASIFPGTTLEEKAAQPRKKTEMVFSVLGNVCKVKGQDIFVEAIKKLGDKRRGCKFIISGSFIDTEFVRKCRELSEGINEIEYIEINSREKLLDVYAQTDVVVVPSRCETLSLTAVEALMLGKGLIVSNSAGICDYFSENKDIVFENESVDDLCRHLENCLKGLSVDRDKLRCIYDKYFSEESFMNRTKELLL